MHIIVTGGAGYIGSHTCLELLQAGHRVSVVDNLANSSREAINRVEQLAGARITFYQVDLLDLPALRQVFLQANGAEAVIHFAGLKAVGESVTQSLRYYQNNLISTLNLAQVMTELEMKKIIFSSSATVYGIPKTVPVKEDFPTAPFNPYGRIKLMTEEILTDLHGSDSNWQVLLLRYFNPVGAHPSGRIGEDPAGIPNNLMPYITQTAAGIRRELTVFGNDYPTPDGTGVRDYIHVVDLARGHAAALDYSRTHPGWEAINLGPGRGSSVLEIVETFQRVNGVAVPHRIGPRRPGDLPTCYAATDKAARLLHWYAEKDLADMCRDSWRWQQSQQ